MTRRLALGLLFALGWLPLYVLRVESFADALLIYSREERRWVWLTPALITLHMSASCVTISFTPAIPAWRAVLSVVVFAGGIAFWVWGRVQIGPVRVRRLPDEPPLQLRRDGAFGIVRHPLYCGYLIAAAAPLLVATRALLGVTFALCAIALATRATQEERRLHAQLGATYEQYCREVKRLVPFVW